MRKRIKSQKSRRKLHFSDFRKYRKKSDISNILKCEEHGFIDMDKIRKAFPDKVKRCAYIDGLIKGLG